MTSLKCDSEILYKLPLNKYNESNIKILVIQDGAKTLKKDMFKYCVNLVVISIPLSIKIIEDGYFGECPLIRIVQCNPVFLNLFNKQYVTTFLVQEGVKVIHKKDFMNINYIQYLHIPASVQSIESGTFFHLKK